MDRREALRIITAFGLTLSLGGLPTTCASGHHALPPEPTYEVASKGQELSVHQATAATATVESRSFVSHQGSMLVKINDHQSDRLCFTVNGRGLYDQGAAGNISWVSFKVKSGDTVEWFDLATDQLVLRLKIT